MCMMASAPLEVVDLRLASLCRNMRPLLEKALRHSSAVRLPRIT